MSDELSRILRKFNINVYTYPYKTIGNILPKIKDSVFDIYKRGAIYKIPCKDCSNVQGDLKVTPYFKITIIYF